jgi:Protein of unknown function (DUF1549)/Protein of unknown function (DUF1553)
MCSRRSCSWLCLVACLVLAWGPASSRSEEPTTAPPRKPDERAVARRVDAALASALTKSATPPLADDETFLRRVTLDLTGKLPPADEIRAFVASNDPDKRGKAIDRLLASEAYAVNWGRYWRDVLTYYTPASGNYLRWELWDRWWVDQVRRNRPWGEITRALVTAEGINDECAPVNFLTAHYGNPIELAATTSRVFLGVQLQCAQCHDAKTEPWRREQFHQFVAFFGRARLVQHKDVEGRGTPYAIEGRADGQYQMTDKKDPSHLITMAPGFLTGDSISADASDQERRAALARFLTSAKNPWFARAYVNRMWTAMMGWGFYPGLADLGSGVAPQCPEVLDLLAQEWVASGYDMRWLFRTIASTEAYQRQLQPRPAAGAATLPAVCPCRLRPEQIFEAMVRALGFDENDKTIPAPAVSAAPAVSRHTGLRHMVYQAFQVDPSLPLDEIQGTIPQALLMMNSALVTSYTAVKGKTFLAEALAKGMSDDDILIALYERTLARKPRLEEIDTCKRYLKKVGNREEALEDVFWCLINSTEFLTKR